MFGIHILIIIHTVVDMKQVHIIAVLVIFSIVLLLFLSSFLPHNESEASTASETEKSKLLRLREEAIRDYVSHLEQEVMQLAIDKKNGKVVVHRDHKDLQRGAVKLTSSTASLSNEANRPRGSSSGIHQRDGGIGNTVVGDLHGSSDPVDGENREVVGSMFEHDTSSQTVLGYSLDKHNPVDAELLQQQTKQKEQDQLEEQHAIEAHIDHKASQTSWTKLVSAFIGQKDAIKAVSVAIDPDFYTWQESLIRKLHCYMKSNSNIAFYHYHARKAAGTTLRDVVKMSLLYAKTISSARSSAQSFRLRSMQSKNYKLPSIIDGYYETEGLVLNPELLQQRDLFTITSLREPISRILSLYWYEHVGWFEGVLRQGERCKTLSQWVEYWRDNSEFKHEFHMKNPGNNYIDIENYYVKMLVGWKGDRVLTRSDLEQAKTILRHFDMVFITEWMEDETQMDVMNALFTGRTQVSLVFSSSHLTTSYTLYVVCSVLFRLRQDIKSQGISE